MWHLGTNTQVDGGPSMSEAVLGIDIGGTNMAGGLISSEGEILHKVEIPTEASRGSEAVFSNIKSVAEELLRWADLKGVPVSRIGISTAGQVDPSAGTILYATDTFPGWTGFPLKQRLQPEFGLEVFVENDALAAGWGEKCFGLAQDAHDFIMLTLGTGVGGAVFARGKLLSGSANLAGLIGHMTVDPYGRPCNCGGRGCVEQYASATAIAKTALQSVGLPSDSVLRGKISRAGSALSAKDVFDAARLGDGRAQEVVAEAALYLGAAIGSLINLLNPELVVLSGGVSRAGDYFLRQVHAAAQQYSTAVAFENVDIRISQFMEYCGVMGAGAVAYTSGIHRLDPH